MAAAAPLVSICIPVYNAGVFIEETISCCVDQTHRNLEIIFSDNCSTDGTYERILAHKDPRIKVYRNETNIGLVPNYIKSLEYATGKYMGFLGADDAMDLTAVEKCVKIMEDPEYQDVVLVNSYVQVIDEKSRVVLKKRFIFGGGRLSGYWGIRSNFIYGSNTIGEPNGSFFRRVTYESIPKPRFKNANMWTMDLDMKFELLLLGNGYMIPEHLGRFRVSRQSTSRDQLRFSQARLFRQYAMNLYRDKRYHLSFFWVLTAAVMSTLMQVARNIFYVLHAREKKS